jgi:hypothetical protein
MNEIEEEKGPKVPYVRMIVDGRPTRVDTNLAFPKWNELLQGACGGIVYLQRHRPSLSRIRSIT